MLLPIVLKSWLQRATLGSVLIALLSIATPASSQSTGIDPDHQKTATPIKHVIVLIGENRTFDHVAVQDGILHQLGWERESAVSDPAPADPELCANRADLPCRNACFLVGGG